MVFYCSECDPCLFIYLVHHGNGTQQIFEDDNTVLYFSVHRYDNGKFYPGTGHANSCGTGKGEGFSVNVPWNDIGMGDHEYLLCWKHILLPIINEFQPDLILVSAGFDAAQGDPIGKMQLTPTGIVLSTFCCSYHYS